MKIEKIKISGFRSIKGPVEIKLSQICAIIGANNVGKSNILSAIYKVLGKDWVTVNTFSEEDVYKQEFEKDIEIEITFSESLKYNQFVGVIIEIPKIKFLYTRYKIGAEKGHRRLEKQCLKLDNNPIFKYKNKPRSGKAPEFEPLSTIPQDIQESIPIIYIGADRNLKSQLPNARNSLLGILLKEINDDFRRDDNLMKINNGNGFEEIVIRKERFNKCISDAILALRTDQAISLENSIKENALIQLGFDPATDSDKLNVFFAPFTSLDFYKSLQVYVQENGYEINAIELGGGFQNAIVIAIMKAFEERQKQGAIFLIEEPEMYLHPQMQRSLYKTIRNIGKTNQVIYITHSPNFVTIPEYKEITIVCKNNEGTIIKQSELDLNAKKIEKFNKELDPERNELFFAKKILLVEGDTEKLAFKEYAKRLNCDIDQVGASVIEVGGKRNLMDFAELVNSFNIPCGIVYDTDSPTFKDKKDEEIAYNSSLDFFGVLGMEIWCFDKNYEDELKKFFGDSQYQIICQKYPGIDSKPIKAKLIAADLENDVPEFVKTIIAWLTKPV